MGSLPAGAFRARRRRWPWGMLRATARWAFQRV